MEREPTWAEKQEARRKWFAMHDKWHAELLAHQRRQERIGNNIFMCVIAALLIWPIPVQIVANGIEHNRLVQARAQAAGVTCLDCPYIPTGIKQSKHVAGVTLPSMALIQHLKQACTSRWVNHGRQVCMSQIGEIERAREVAYLELNPPYGRPELTGGQQKYIQHATGWLRFAVPAATRRWLPSQYERFSKQS